MSHALDGIDGKQARRTGRSSPLGELFDHGVDASALVLIISAAYNLFGQNDDGFGISPIRMYALLCWNISAFHLVHWEKYNTGIFHWQGPIGITAKKM